MWAAQKSAARKIFAFQYFFIFTSMRLRKRLTLLLSCLLPALLPAQEYTLPDSIQKQIEAMPDTLKVRTLIKFAHKTNATNYDGCLEIAGYALKLSEKINFHDGSGEAYKAIGLANYFKGNHDKALENYVFAVKAFEKNKNQRGVAYAEIEIGNLYRKNGDAGKALEYFKRAIEYFKKTGDQSGEATTNNHLGTAYETLKDYDKAMDHYSEALNIYYLIDDTLGKSYSLDNMAGIFMIRGQFDSCFAYQQQSLSIRRVLKDKHAESMSLNNIGEMFKAKPDYRQAINYFLESVALSRAIGFRDLEMYTYNELAQCYDSLRDYLNAYRYNKLHFRMKDSIYSENKNRTVAELKTKYDTEKKEQENKILSLELEQGKTRQNILIISIIGVIIISVLLYNRYKIKQREILNGELLKQEQLRTRAIILTQEQERKRIAEELHDGIGQMMSAVKLNVSALEKSNVADSSEQFKNALSLIDDSCTEIRNISHNMMPGVLIKKGLAAAVREFASKINSAGEIKIHVEEGDAGERIDSITEINIFRIIQELVNNILKYAGAREVQVQINREEGLVTVMIEDDGKGFDKNILKTSTGNGWNNINSRLNLLNGKIEIDSNPGKGTVVFLEIPVNVTV